MLSQGNPWWRNWETFAEDFETARYENAKTLLDALA
jgi:hypothetical protein